MNRNMKALLGVAALLVALAGPAVAQEKQMVWKTDGKRYFRTEELVAPFEMPKTQLLQVAEKEEGAILGFKYAGKRLEPVYFKEVPLAAEMPKKGHECGWRMVYENKGRTTRYNFCLVNGVEQPCPGMQAGECVGKK